MNQQQSCHTFPQNQHNWIKDLTKPSLSTVSSLAQNQEIFQLTQPHTTEIPQRKNWINLYSNIMAWFSSKQIEYANPERLSEQFIAQQKKIVSLKASSAQMLGIQNLASRRKLSRGLAISI